MAIGIVTIVTGLAVRFVAIATLKRDFSGALRISADHTLVKTGIYGQVRHPADLGAILIFAGIPVMFSSLLGFLVMLLLVPYLLHRVKLEEKMMIERFGKGYEESVRSSKRLIPFVYWGGANLALQIEMCEGRVICPESTGNRRREQDLPGGLHRALICPSATHRHASLLYVLRQDEPTLSST